jgi:RNA polymerase sigma factor (sigma-70 family)
MGCPPARAQRQYIMNDAPMTDDQLLCKFVNAHDATAFAQIVQRHAGMVYSAASRQVGAAMADDVTQAVFIMLHRKAGRLNGATLAGWLVRAARLAALEARRSETRLKAREQKAVAMKEQIDIQHPGSALWTGLSPRLDEALAKLGDRDRSVVTLRYLEGKTIPEVAAAMGASESAIAKQLTRAIAKLKRNLAHHAIVLEAAVLTELLLEHGEIACPSHVAANAAAIALAGGTSALSPTGAILARGALTAMSAKTIWIGVTAALVLLLAGGGALYHAAAGAAAPPAASSVKPSATTRDSKPIKVGVIVSLFTATGPHWLPNPHGYAGAQLILRELRDSSIECIPIIESGSESDAALQAVLKNDFAGKKPLVAVDAAHLADLDVIVAARVANATDELLTAVEGRVTQGAGLLIRQSFGVITPGYTPQVTALNGFVEAQYALTQGGAGKVVAGHPLLGSLKAGRMLKLGSNGAYGKLAVGGIGLIEMAGGNVNPIGDNARQRDDFIFYPVYVSQLGKGKIVGCSFSGSQPAPADLNAAAGGKFTVRCVKWLAGRAFD